MFHFLQFFLSVALHGILAFPMNIAHADTPFSTYANEELGVTFKFPQTWIRQDSGYEELVLIQIRYYNSDLPFFQITTRPFGNDVNAPKSAVEHLTRYVEYLHNVTYLNDVEPITETDLNGTSCANTSFHTDIILEGSTYSANYVVYSFWRPDRTIDLTIIEDRNADSNSQKKMDLQAILNSVSIMPK